MFVDIEQIPPRSLHMVECEVAAQVPHRDRFEMHALTLGELAQVQVCELCVEQLGTISHDMLADGMHRLTLAFDNAIKETQRMADEVRQQGRIRVVKRDE